MMYKEDLRTNILLWKEFIAEWENNPVLNIESKLYSIPGRIFDHLIEEVLTIEGADLLYWWLYEDVKKVIYPKEGSPVDVEALSALLDYMYKNAEVYIK